MIAYNEKYFNNPENGPFLKELRNRYRSQDKNSKANREYDSREEYYCLFDRVIAWSWSPSDTKSEISRKVDIEEKK